VTQGGVSKRDVTNMRGRGRTQELCNAMARVGSRGVSHNVKGGCSRQVRAPLGGILAITASLSYGPGTVEGGATPGSLFQP